MGSAEPGTGGFRHQPWDQDVLVGGSLGEDKGWKPKLVYT